MKERVCFAITLGKMILPESKLIADCRREVFLTPMDTWQEQFANGDTMEVMVKKVAPHKILTENGLTDLNFDSIKDAAKKKGIRSYRLERNTETNWMFLIGSMTWE